MSKMHYFSNKFSKFANRSPLNLWWSEITWFCQFMVFQADCDEIEFHKSVMTIF